MSIEYKYTQDKKIDWKAMIPREFLVVNRQKYLDKKQNPPDSIEGLPDSDLLLLLNGVRYLADLRGFSKIEYPVIDSSPNHCTAVCRITWLPHLDNNNIEIVSSAIGDCTPENAKGFARYYLGPIAENRAFVRCVRNFLRIPVVGQDEIGDVKLENESKTSNDSLVSKDNLLEKLKKLMTEKNKSFDDLKKRLVKDQFVGAENLSSIDDFPIPVIYNFIEKLQALK